MKPLQHKRETNVMKNDEDGTWKTETRTERGKKSMENDCVCNEESWEMMRMISRRIV